MTGLSTAQLGSSNLLPGMALSVLSPETDGVCVVRLVDPSAASAPTPVSGIAGLIAVPTTTSATDPLSRNVRRYLARRQMVHERLVGQPRSIPTVIGYLGRSGVDHFDLVFAPIESAIGVQWLHTAMIEDALVPAVHGEVTTIFTGSCLFSGGSLRLFGASGTEHVFLRADADPGETITQIHHDPRPSVYELETVLRLCRTVAMLISQFEPGRLLRIVLDLPREQYLMKLWYWHAIGVLGQDTFRDLCRLVDQRAKLLAGLFRDCLDQLLDQSYRVEGVNELSRIISDGELPAPGTALPLPEAALSLLTDGDPVWTLATRLRPPEDWLDLIRATYTTAVLRAVLTGDGPVVLVDDVSEMPTTTTTRRLLRLAAREGLDIPRHRFGSVYPLGGLLIPGEAHGSLYFAKLPQKFLLPDGRLVGPTELVTWGHNMPEYVLPSVQ